MLLNIVLYVVFLTAFVALFVVAGMSRARFLDRRRLAAEQARHQRSKLRLQEVLQTVPGAELVVVRRVISSSLRGSQVAVFWPTTGVSSELWFARACPVAGDSLAIAGADPTTVRVDRRNVLARAAADPVATIEQG